MNFKRKLFVRFIHESNFELPMIKDLLLKKWTRRYLRKVGTLSYVRKKNILPSSNNGLAYLRRNINRKSFSQLPLAFSKTKKNINQDDARKSSETQKPNFLTFLDRKLDHLPLLSHDASIKMSEVTVDTEATFSDSNVSVLPEPNEDFLDWLGEKEKAQNSNEFDENWWSGGYSKRISFTNGVRSSKDKNISCEVCGKMYSTKNGLAYHMVWHSGTFPYCCKLCLQSFKSSSSLHRHNRNVHLKKKDFECNQCHKLFFQKSNLSKHMDSHFGVRKFKCDICQKSFIQRIHLNNHLVTHSEKKSFQCGTCNKMFVKQFCLDRHMKNIHMF